MSAAAFRRIRILVLLGVLAAAVALTWLEQTIVRAWRVPLEVVVTPINGDGSPLAAAKIAALRADEFDAINAFLAREAARYGVRLDPAMHVTVMPESRAHPPAPPRDRNILKVIWWSLKLRWWVYQQSDSWLPQLGRIKLFVLYHTSEAGVALEHSLGLNKGLIGVVHAYADPGQANQNKIVIAHELLHTLGATDKYGPDGKPVYPEGYADPGLPPAMPQREAEIMAGRYLAPNGEAVMPPGLDRCVIGAKTANEINFDAAFRARFTSPR